MLLSIVRALESSTGIAIRRHGIFRVRPKKIGKLSYGNVIPMATYSPWLTDSEFARTYDIVSSNTLVDRLRAFELWELTGQVGHLPGNILEVGVWRGGTGTLIAARAKALGMSKRVYLCDTFAGVVKASERDSSYSGGEHADASESDVRTLANKLGLDNIEIRKGIFPDDFQTEMDKHTFCFVHIDVDVYQSAKDVFSYVWPKVPVGGVVVFDDFGFETCDGIPGLIDEYRGHSDKVIVHNLNGHAVVIKAPLQPDRI
jgi:O-methyltransferase